MSHDELYMKRCLELAARGKGQVAPNPMVGAVLVHEDRVIGEGWHRQYGEAHAEVNCLESVDPALRHLIPASTMYVSLEPCAHYGKTPPCALRIIEEKISRVVICNDDPFEQVDGKGIKMLEAKAIATETGLLKQEGAWLNRRFFCFHANKRPYIILKWAQTDTGIFAPADRSRFQITNKASQQLVHKWRTEEAAIMVGYNTALHDDPRLTSRLWHGKQPLRIVLDRDLQLPPQLKLFNNEAPTWVINQVEDNRDAGLTRIKIFEDNNLIPELLNRLYREGINSLIVEGGASLLAQFITQDIWDEARIFSALSNLTDGIAAPLLKNASHAFQTVLDGDRLDIYIHKNSGYPYADGMEL